MNRAKKRVVVIGGGAGTFTVLTGLKKYNCDLTAIVAMADDGGSTGALRRELGVLPPGDVRQCLVALSRENTILRFLMNYRFAEGTLRGHNFGNLLLAALEKLTGSFDKAVETTSKILRIYGHVVPSTLQKTTLVAHINGRTVRGQSAIHKTHMHGKVPRLHLSPSVEGNPKALAAIKKADAIVICPGDLYSSVVPNFLVRGIPETIGKSSAQKLFVCNLTSRAVHTPHFSVADYTNAIDTCIGTLVDVIIYNNARLPRKFLKKYMRKGEVLTRINSLPQRCLVGKHFIEKTPTVATRGDTIQRSRIRHNPQKLASVIAHIVHISPR